MSKNFEAIKTAAEQHMAEFKVPGIALGIIHDGTVEMGGIGITNVNNPSRSRKIQSFTSYDTTDIGVAFDDDVEKVEQLLIDAAGSVDGVHKERGIDSRLESFTRDEMIFRVGWWMKDNDDYYKLRQLVNRAIVKIFREAGVTFPYRKEQVELEPNSERSEIPRKSRSIKSAHHS